MIDASGTHPSVAAVVLIGVLASAATAQPFNVEIAAVTQSQAATLDLWPLFDDPWTGDVTPGPTSDPATIAAPPADGAEQSFRPWFGGDPVAPLRQSAISR